VETILRGRLPILSLLAVLVVGACRTNDQDPSSGLTGSTSLRDVDFKNFSYPYVESEPTEEWELVDPAKIIPLSNGKHDFSDGGYLYLDSVVHGDLDNDSVEEAAVVVHFGTGGTQGWEYVYVFRAKGEAPELIARFVSGTRADGGLAKADISAGKLVLDLQDSERRTADCCSLGFVRRTYQLQSGAFTEIGERTRDSFRNRVYPLDLSVPGSVKSDSDGNIAYVDLNGRSHVLTSSGKNSAPSLSNDKKAVVFVKNENEIWTVRVDGEGERKIFACATASTAWTCDIPQYSVDDTQIYFVRETGEEGGVWRVDLKTGAATLFIPDSAQFVVIPSGPNRNSLVADQRTMPEESSPEQYPTYPFFLFSQAGAKLAKVGQDTDYIFDLAKELGQ
jgi:hypothetical protein